MRTQAGEQRDPERYAELLLLLDGAAAARGVLEGILEAEAAWQEFRAGSVTVDFSGEEYDDLDRVIGGQILLELEEEDEPGFELVRFGRLDELVSYESGWDVMTVPGCGGVLARLDLEFNRPHRFSLRLLFDVTSHQWALRAMELTGNCRVEVRKGNERRRVNVRAARSAQLMSALTVVRMLDPLANVYEDYDLDEAGIGGELDAAFEAEQTG